MRQTINEIMGLAKSIPVVERYRRAIHISFNEEDNKSAKRASPTTCVIACAYNRGHGFKAAIFSRVAYFEMRDNKNRPFIAKLQATLATKTRIRTFDRTGTMPQGGLEFIPIAESHTYAARRIAAQKNYQGPKKGKLKGPLKRKMRKAAPSYLRVAPKFTATAARYTD